MKSLEQMIDESHKLAAMMGWHEEAIPFPQAAALLHSEVSEAFEAWRKRGFESWNVRTLKTSTDCPACQAQTDPKAPECEDHPDKPEGVGSEFADVFIRLLHYCRYYGIDLRAEYERKMRYNRTREHRHGGKRA